MEKITLFKKSLRWIKENRLEFLALVLLLCLSAFLRLYKIADYMTFLGDEGRDVLVVKRIIVDHKPTLLGPTASVGGFFLGPIYYYFMVPFLWAFKLDPVGPAVMVALFGIATVFLVWKVGRDFFHPPIGRQVGLLAASLYSISPLVITYSRSSWNPNLMPFFSLLIIFLTWKMVVFKKPKLFPIIGFLFGIAIQLHYLTVFLMVVISFYLLIFFRHFNLLKYYFQALIGFILGWLPFILFELRHGFPNFKTLYRFILFGEETGFSGKEFFPIVSDVSLRLFSRLVTNNQVFLAKILLLFSVFIFVFNLLKKREEKKILKTYSLFTLWFLIGVLLFGFYRKGIYDYYFGFIFPLPFLLTSFSLVKIGQKKFLGKLAAFLLFFLLVFLNLKGIPFRYEPNRQLAQTKKIARFILDKTQDKPFNFALVSGGNSDHAYRYFFEIWNNKPVTIQNPEVDPERKTVTTQLFVVCETPCSPEGHSLWEIAGFGRAQIESKWQVSVVEVYKLKHWHGEEENI